MLIKLLRIIEFIKSQKKRVNPSRSGALSPFIPNTTFQTSSSGNNLSIIILSVLRDTPKQHTIKRQTDRVEMPSPLPNEVFSLKKNKSVVHK